MSTEAAYGAIVMPSLIATVRAFDLDNLGTQVG
jgi:hypothetical protein